MKDDLCERLRSALFGKPEKPKKGFLTSAQWASKWNVAQRTAQRMIQSGLKSGLMTMETFRLTTNRRGLVPVEHYAKKKG